MRRAKIALALGLMTVGLVMAAVLTGSPLVVAGTNSIAIQGSTATKGDIHGCEPGGDVPAGTTAIRISLAAVVGPRVGITVLSGSRVVTEGERGSGWGTQDNVIVPVRRVARAVPDAFICTTIGPAVEPKAEEGLVVDGTLVRRFTTEARLLDDAWLRMQYLRPGPKSWWSLAPSIAYNMGLGHAAGGTWLVFLVLALMIVVATLSLRLVLAAVAADQYDLVRMRAGRTARLPAKARAAWTRAVSRVTAHERIRLRRQLGVGRVLRRVPRAAWICAVVACLNATCWSIITPPFQVPDEPSHFAYTQQLAQNVSLPTSDASSISLDEGIALRDLHFSEVRAHPNAQTLSTAAEQRLLQADLSRHLSRSGGGGVGGAYNAPPLYYLLEVIPYGLASGGTLLDQLELMRLLSSLMGAVTAMFAFLFVRETLPAVRWAWTVGGLSVALAPLLGFMSGAMNPDAMLYAVSAAIFYCLARGFRRGLTRRLAVAIGALTAVGFATKLNFIGLAPGVILGLIVLSVRSARAGRRAALLTLGAALALAASPVYLYVLANLLSGHPLLGEASSIFTGAHVSVLGEISYIWQLYLPRLPGMSVEFPGLSTTIRLWFDRSVGLYGWLDTYFPLWVDNVALVFAGLTAGLFARSLILDRSALRRRLGELTTYSVIGLGLLALIGSTAYLTLATEGGAGDGEPRYLLPLLPLLAVVLALAVRGAGRRWGPAVGTLLVVLILAHDIFSQLLVVSRYYG